MDMLKKILEIISLNFLVMMKLESIKNAWRNIELNKISYQILSSDDLDEKYLKIKLNSDDDLPLPEILKTHDAEIAINFF